MTRAELDALIAKHDRWSAYDALCLILIFAAALALIGVGIMALWSGFTGLAVIVTPVGFGAATYALHAEPYQAR